jgi:hypothetical protein
MDNQITLINKSISIQELKNIANQRFGDMVKGVVDIDKEIIALGADLHADEESFLLEKGSKQANLWGINLYPDLPMPDFLEFDSMINLRPNQNNRSRSVDDPQICDKIKEIVTKLIQIP